MIGLYSGRLKFKINAPPVDKKTNQLIIDPPGIGLIKRPKHGNNKKIINQPIQLTILFNDISGSRCSDLVLICQLLLCNNFLKKYQI